MQVTYEHWKEYVPWTRSPQYHLNSFAAHLITLEKKKDSACVIADQQKSSIN